MKKISALLAILLMATFCYADVYTSDTTTTNYDIGYLTRGSRNWDDKINLGLSTIDTLVSVLSDDTGTTNTKVDILSNDAAWAETPAQVSLIIPSRSVIIGPGDVDGDFNVVQTAEANDINFDTYSDANSYTLINIKKSSSDTAGTKSETFNGDILGYIQFRGCDSGDNFDNGAQIYVQQFGDAGTKVPTKIFMNAYSSTGSQNNQFVLSSDGGIIMDKLPTGATQAAAGAEDGELWADSDDGYTIKLGQ